MPAWDKNWKPEAEEEGGMDGTVVRALASYQCVPGLIPGPGVICGLIVSMLLVLVLAPRVFLRVLRFSSLLKNQHNFLNSNSIGNSRATGLLLSDCYVYMYVLPLLNKVDYYYYFHNRKYLCFEMF